MRCRLLLLAGLVVFPAGLVHAGDAAKGATVFRKCQACHTATEAKNRVGPTLQNVVGRPVAEVEGFRYSQAMVDFGAGKVWDEALLAAYLAAPRQVVKGTSMAFAGLKKPEEVADVIAYLKNPAEAP